MAVRTLSYSQDQAYAVARTATATGRASSETAIPYPDYAARTDLAEQAVRLINSGDCVRARGLVARRGDAEMLARVDEVCGAPAQPTKDEAKKD